MGLFRSKSETYADATIAVDVERGLVARYLARILERGDLPLRGLLSILYWLNERRGFLNFTIDDELSALVGKYYSGGVTFDDFDRLYRREREKLIAGLRRAAEETPRPEPLASNIEMLTRELGLPDAALKVVGLIACYTRYDQVQYLCDTLTNVSGPLGRSIAMLVGEPARTVEGLIAPSGELAACGLIQVREKGDQVGGRFAVPWRVDACLDLTYPNFPSLRAALLGDPLEPSLNLSDYDHVAEDCDLIKRVIEGASREGARGINILILCIIKVENLIRCPENRRRFALQPHVMQAATAEENIGLAERLIVEHRLRLSNSAHDGVWRLITYDRSLCRPSESWSLARSGEGHRMVFSNALSGLRPTAWGETVDAVFA